MSLSIHIFPNFNNLEYLLFKVNTSGQFVGLAEMVGPVDFNKTVEYWQQDKWTGCFPLKWHIIKDVPNGCLRHITLENNENKPVTNSRDTQEVIKLFSSPLPPFFTPLPHLFSMCVYFGVALDHSVYHLILFICGC